MKEKLISIIYAHRNRDIKRIQISLESLRKQDLHNFEVVFVDYGSDKNLVHNLKSLTTDFPFFRLIHLPVPQLLWNKSKALNYGIVEAKGEFIFIADTDLIFHRRSTQLLKEIASPNNFNLFKLGYLNKTDSLNLEENYSFENLKPARYGAVNGMILTSKNSLLKINGLDEFFHFYGAEDEDLFSRLETSGLKKTQRDEKYFYHQWHRSFSGSEDKLLTGNPRVKNIMRINQRHFEFNRDLQVLKPFNQQGLGAFISENVAQRLNNPTLKYRITNIQAHVEHFLREELPSFEKQIIKAIFFEDEYSKSIKHSIKKGFGKQSQPYITMKEVNDMVLKEILFNYRNHNYSYKVAEDLKSIEFCLEL